MPKRKLDKEYRYRGATYGPGDSVEVPEGFKAGQEIKPKPQPKTKKTEKE